MRGGGRARAVDVNLSTQENYRAEGREFHGEFRWIRSELNYDYHGKQLKRAENAYLIIQFCPLVFFVGM